MEVVKRIGFVETDKDDRPIDEVKVIYFSMSLIPMLRGGKDQGPSSFILTSLDVRNVFPFRFQSSSTDWRKSWKFHWS